jgi:hypothetical protein
MVDFASLAAVKVEDLPEVKLMPMGTYIWSVDRIPEQKPSASGASELINFRCRCVGPIDDFEDPDGLDAYGSPAGEIRTLMFTFPLNPYEDEDQKRFEQRQIKAAQRVRRFLAVDVKAEGTSIGEMLTNSVNCQFLGQIVHEVDNRNPDGPPQERLQGTAPLA